MVGDDVYGFYTGAVGDTDPLDYYQDKQLRRGRVEVCVGAAYGTVCNLQWTNQDASVVCRYLGYSPFGVWVWLCGCVSVSCDMVCRGGASCERALC